MIKYFKLFICCVLLISIITTSTGCDRTQEPFIISNTLDQTVVLQIFSVLSEAYPDPIHILVIGREGEQSSETSLHLVANETVKIYSGIFSGGIKAYIIVINDLDSKELFRRTFQRDDLVKHEFRLSITEEGIDFSP